MLLHAHCGMFCSCPGDTVVREGEIGEEMFFIRYVDELISLPFSDEVFHVGIQSHHLTRMDASPPGRHGEVEVSVSGKGVVAVKGSASFFGEVALMNSGHRIATVT